MYTIARNWFPHVDVSLPLNLREKKRGKINILKKHYWDNWRSSNLEFMLNNITVPITIS